MSIADPVIADDRIQSMVDLGRWRNKTLLNDFDKAVLLHSSKPAIIGYLKDTGAETSVSYQQLADISDRLAAGMLNKGIKKGDVVSFQLPNWWEFVAVFLACMRIGAISNPLMPIYRENELTYMLNFGASKLMFIPDKFKGFDHAQMLESLNQTLPALESICVVGQSSLTPFLVEKVTAEHRAAFDENSLSANDVFLLMYTSGTTGAPKGVMHTPNTHEYAARKYIERTKLSASEVIFMGSPTAHMTGLMFGVTVPLMLGATSVLLDQWDPSLAWKIIHDKNVAFTMGATPFLADLCDSELVASCNQDDFRLFVCGGAPVPPALARRASKKLNVNLMTVWGMTEMSVATATLLTDSEEKLFETDGCPYDGTEIRVVNDQGMAVKHGEEGRLQVRGAGNFVGYLKRPEAYDTDKAGWFDTGDLAKIIHQHYVRITGRSKDIIIRGGENIPVVTLENALYRHPAVQDAAIVSKPDDRLGERACCFMTVRHGDHLTLQDMQAYLLEEGISKNYWPEYLDILNEMPRTASGKIQKFKLRDMAKKLA